MAGELHSSLTRLGFCTSPAKQLNYGMIAVSYDSMYREVITLQLAI